jgi:hypothetical protein
MEQAQDIFLRSSRRSLPMTADLILRNGRFTTLIWLELVLLPSETTQRTPLS